MNVCFESKVRLISFGIAVFFMLGSRLLLYSAESGVNRVKVVLPGFSVSLLCFVQAKTVCMYCYMYVLAALACVYVMLISSALLMT